MTFPSSSHHNKSQLDSLAARSCRSPLSHKRWARAVRCGHQGPRPDDCLVISDEKGPDFGCLIFFLFLGSIIIFPWFSRFFPHLFFFLKLPSLGGPSPWSPKADANDDEAPAQAPPAGDGGAAEEMCLGRFFLVNTREYYDDIVIILWWV